ncbi:MAG: 50S ribosomal protein L16, partial [Halobacteriota archaeon]
QAPVVKEAFRRAYNKITPPCKINVERGADLLVS